jgi:hypothetical protein
MITTLLVAASLSAGPDEAITKKNWATHPKIAEIRALVQQVDEAVQAKRLKNEERTDCQMEGAGKETESIDRDASGVIRKYAHELGSEDSEYRAEAYYDEKGRLRFVLAQRGAAANGSSGEFRIYFGEDGKKLWTDVKEKGPGYTWQKDFPERWLVKDPEKAWKNPPACE